MASGATGSPPASGVRLPWSAVPASLRADVEAILGEPVVEAVTQPGGFSPGVAAGADPDAVTTVLTAVAGYFVYRGGLPPPPGLPTVRAFQAAQGRHAVDWLRVRLGD
jgi:hypothetical protein